ncbi:MAG: glucose-1-phosphate adenylyltransferase [Candidatus Omnitrophica bacterium]|nr:glucose-1-phosphate adenylyltransferase [Candidatus Omnitrophota bacterium]
MLKGEVLAMIMAGGKGQRLDPLTLERSKPSVPFGGKYRIIDFVLSNFVNSGIYSIYVLVQYKSQSLIEHIRSGWKRQGMLSKHFITVVPPQMRKDSLKQWYRGTADSIYQNINLILDFSPSLVAVFGSDHVYRMNIRQIIDFHVKNKADVTISCMPKLRQEASSFGIVEVNPSCRVTGFKEKPSNPKAIPGNKDYSYVSMGNYIFNTKVLLEVLEKDTHSQTTHDFGRDVMPPLIKSKKVFAYNFSANNIPGIKKYEEQSYWRDVGTIDEFFEAHMDLLGQRPLLDLSNSSWPVYGSTVHCPPAKINECLISNSLISEGCIIQKAKIENSVLGRAVVIEEGAEIKDSIIMDFTHIRKKTKIRKAIIDRFNILEESSLVGYNADEDRKKYFVSKNGVTVLKRGPRQVFY